LRTLIAEKNPGFSRSHSIGHRIALLMVFVFALISCLEMASAQESALVHIVQSGETLWGISRQYGIDMETLALVNELDNPDSLKVGQKLLISASQSVDYVVQRGDSLWSIATAFGVSVDSIAGANGIADPSKIRAGDKLTIPLGVGGVAVMRLHLEHRVVPGDTLWGIGRIYGVSVSSITAANPGVNANRLRVGDIIKVPLSYSASSLRAGGPKYIWPVSGGRLTSEYGWRKDPFTGQRAFHGGVDFGLPEGSPIYASGDGIVIEAGLKGGFGRAVVIQHDDGLVTLYAHASKVLVSVGTRVRQGQLIARVGSTGRATGPHLHFEVRKGEATIDPMSLIPGAR
jgi:murein DD-endopeptidase MepM/ murein hydrolase activator NlpD